jgi:hypothetical protein
MLRANQGKVPTNFRQEIRVLVFIKSASREITGNTQRDSGEERKIPVPATQPRERCAEFASHCFIPGPASCPPFRVGKLAIVENSLVL